MTKNLVLIELGKDQVIISVSGEPIKDAALTINRTFHQRALDLPAGANYVRLQQVRDEDGRFLSADEVSEIRLVGSQGGRGLDTTAEFAHDARSISVQHIKRGKVEPE